MITNSKKIDLDKRTVKLLCECGYLFTVTVRFSDDYKTADIFLHNIFINPLVAYQTQNLIEKHRNYLIKQAKEKIGITLLKAFALRKNTQGYCIANNMDNSMFLVFEIDPDADKESIDILLEFKKNFEDVFYIENFKDALISHKHIWSIDYVNAACFQQY